MAKILTPQQQEKWEKMSQKRGMKAKRAMHKNHKMEK